MGVFGAWPAGEVVSPSTATKLVATVFGASLVVSIAVFLVTAPKVKHEHLAGRRTANLTQGLVSVATQSTAVELVIAPSGRGFVMHHPLGRVEGSVYLEGTTVRLGFSSVGGVPHHEWVQNWTKRRLEILRRARLQAHTVAVDHPLALVLNAPTESEALRLLKQHHAEDAVDPFNGTWRYEILRADEWRSLSSSQPDL